MLGGGIGNGGDPCDWNCDDDWEYDGDLGGENWDKGGRCENDCEGDWNCDIICGEKFGGTKIG